MQLNHCKCIDLTQPLSPNVPTWNGSCGYCLEIKKDYDRVFRVHQMKLHAGVGTHMDAPSHRFEGGLSIADIPVDQLIAPACVIDVSDKATSDYEISVSDIEKYEKTHGAIPKGALVIGFTGWSRFWLDPAKYRNCDSHGKMHFPGVSGHAAALLLQRDIVGLAIDTLSPDCLDDTFPVHRSILGAGKYIIENIADCTKMPPKGAYVIALPLRAEESSEAPMRIIGLIP